MACFFDLKSALGFYLLYATVFNFVYAEPVEDTYKKTVQSVSYRIACEKTIAIIQLNDETTWIVSMEAEDDMLLMDIEQNLTPGKEVFIYPKPDNWLFWLIVQTKFEDQWYSVGITKESKNYIANQIAKLEKVEIKKGGWFSKPVYGYHIFLTDGTSWFANESTQGIWAIDRWEIQDKILVCKSPEGQWSLVNIDTTYFGYRWAYNLFPIE